MQSYNIYKENQIKKAKFHKEYKTAIKTKRNNKIKHKVLNCSDFVKIDELIEYRKTDIYLSSVKRRIDMKKFDAKYNEKWLNNRRDKRLARSIDKAKKEYMETGIWRQIARPSDYQRPQSKD